MRHLLNTLFILTEDSYLTLEGETVQVLQDDKTLGSFPLHTLEGILYFGYKGASPALMGACASKGVDLCFYRPSGRFLARVSGESRGNVLLRRTQYRWADDSGQALAVARNFITGKLYNARWVLERTARDHALRVDVESLKTASAAMQEAIGRVSQAATAESLRGIEGEAASTYFSVFDQMILQNRQAFSFQGRNRRPPLDPTNALLSFLYSILANNCAAALEGVGLDSYVGFLHTDRPGRQSLALDLMEELRPVMADRFALTCINNRVITPAMFDFSENGAVTLNDKGRRAVLTAWQEKKREEITHPYLKEKMPWGLVPNIQALLLARHLRGDKDAYPPFLWK